ncbi:MAG: hypothetical protein HZC37_04095 [Burkholderiales bacterium]|nr:hypothetical protein [Burkholderiales bacterium]
MTDACTHARPAHHVHADCTSASRAQPRGAGRTLRHRHLPWASTTLLALACAVLIIACGGSDPEVPVAQQQPVPAESAEVPTTALPESLWGAEGRAKGTLPEDRPAYTAAKWSSQRYATRAQLAAEELIAGPYTLVIDADDEAAVESGLQYADAVHTFAGGRELLGIFVRSRQPALAARLAERLTHEQGWANVFVVI